MIGIVPDVGIIERRSLYWSRRWRCWSVPPVRWSESGRINQVSCSIANIAIEVLAAQESDRIFTDEMAILSVVVSGAVVRSNTCATVGWRCRLHVGVQTFYGRISTQYTAHLPQYLSHHPRRMTLNEARRCLDAGCVREWTIFRTGMETCV